MNKISFIIVSYNEEKLIDRAIESCIHNKYSNYEIIIGDDGSNDNSIDRIKYWENKYPNIIKYFIMDRNDIKIIPSIRVSRLLKKAFSLSTGEYYALLSADDYFCEKKYSEVEFLDNNKKYVSCYSNYLKSWPDGNDIKTNFKYSLNSKVLFAYRYIHISAFVFRRSVLDNILENFCDDTGMMYSIICSGKCKFLNHIGFSYTQRNGSIMHEADKNELCLLEMSLLQDILNCCGNKGFVYCRFYGWLKYAIKNYKFFSDSKYDKFFELFDESIILHDLRNYSDSKSKKRINKIYKKSNYYRFIYYFKKRINQLFCLIKK